MDQSGPYDLGRNIPWTIPMTFKTICSKIWKKYWFIQIYFTRNIGPWIQTYFTRNIGPSRFILLEILVHPDLFY